MGSPSPALTAAKDRTIKALLLDMWCFIPFYMAALSVELERQMVHTTVASATYHLDPKYFENNKIRNNPGVIDIVGRLRISNPRIRRSLKLLEYCANLVYQSLKVLSVGAEIVHVHFLPLLSKGIPVELWFLKYVKKLGSKVICTVHNVLPHDTGDRHRKRYIELYWLSDLLICHNAAARKVLREELGIPDERIRIIPHGPLQVDTSVPQHEARSALGLPRETPVVLWQGVIAPYIGIDFLLSSWARLQSNAYLVIAGKGEQACVESLQNKVRELDIESSVRLDIFYIQPERLPYYYQAADILVYPYKNITTSGALITWIGYGKPVVATDLPAFVELIKDNESGLLVKYGDEDALARALKRLIEAPDLRAQMARNAKVAADQQYSWAAIARKTRECYEELLAEAH